MFSSIRFLLSPKVWFVLACIPYCVLAADTETTDEVETSTDSETSDSSSITDETEATAETKTALSRYMPKISLKRAESLLHHMELMNRADEVVTISSPKADFYGLYLPHAAASPQGAVLILHDQQQHGHWPEVVGPLRDYLPQFGWSTLTIELPDHPKRQRIPREETSNKEPSNNEAEDDDNQETPEGDDSIAKTEDNESTDLELSDEEKDNAGPSTESAENINAEVDEDAEPALPRLQKLPDIETQLAESEDQDIITVDDIADFQEQTRDYVQSAIGYLHSQNQYNLIVIGYGRGAAWAVDYVHQQLSQDEEPKGLTLITIDALPEYYDQVLMNQQLQDITIPYLDLLQPTEFDRARDAKKRSAIMKRNGNKNYRQIITQAVSSYHETENPTSRRIRGWIMRNAGGTKVNVKP